MRWEHECSIEWLQARKKYLTASAIGSLAKAKKRGPAAYRKKLAELQAEKMQEVLPDDCKSYGAAARGHLLEPYAIRQLAETTGIGFWHWDDVVLYSPSGFGYSPDALSVLCPDVGSCDRPANLYWPAYGAEVKSYGASKHMQLMTSPISMLDERWQLACAFATLPSLKAMFLVGFNPSMGEKGFFSRRVERTDLSLEIKECFEILDDWNDADPVEIPKKVYVTKADWSELQIYSETMEPYENVKDVLNP